MTHTENYNLNMPDDDDFFDAEHMNENMETIDTAMHDMEVKTADFEDKIGSSSDTVTTTIMGKLNKISEQLAKEKHREKDYRLYAMVEELAPKIIGEERHIYKGVSANVDFYSGFVYSMLDLPLELYTPMFACARIVGWSAHRMEELINTDKIIRPAYKSVKDEVDYVPLENR